MDEGTGKSTGQVSPREVQWGNKRERLRKNSSITDGSGYLDTDTMGSES
jgi:hypothetical protein